MTVGLTSCPIELLEEIFRHCCQYYPGITHDSRGEIWRYSDGNLQRLSLTCRAFKFSAQRLLCEELRLEKVETIQKLLESKLLERHPVHTAAIARLSTGPRGHGWRPVESVLSKFFESAKGIRTLVCTDFRLKVDWLLTDGLQGLRTLKLFMMSMSLGTQLKPIQSLNTILPNLQHLYIRPSHLDHIRDIHNSFPIKLYPNLKKLDCDADLNNVMVTVVDRFEDSEAPQAARESLTKFLIDAGSIARTNLDVYIGRHSENMAGIFPALKNWLTSTVNLYEFSFTFGGFKKAVALSSLNGYQHSTLRALTLQCFVSCEDDDAPQYFATELLNILRPGNFPQLERLTFRVNDDSTEINEWARAIPNKDGDKGEPEGLYEDVFDIKDKNDLLELVRRRTGWSSLQSAATNRGIEYCLLLEKHPPGKVFSYTTLEPEGRIIHGDFCTSPVNGN